MARFQDNSEKSKEGYNQIHDSITDANSISDLIRAVERSIPIIATCKLDDYQQNSLEKYALRKYNSLTLELSRIESTLKHNKFKK